MMVSVLHQGMAASWVRCGKRTISVLSCLKSPSESGSLTSSLFKPTVLAAKIQNKVDEVKPVENSTTGEMKSATESISKAMKSYLERAEAHHKFMKEQEEEFSFGRRHLANMMGKDPETFTQQDVEEAIRYLFPAAVSTASAKPMMKPPSQIYPKAKAAQFDASGRPHHPFFYTTRANFYNIVYEATTKINNLDALSIAPTDDQSGDTTFSGTVWLSKEELEERTIEALSDVVYNQWVLCMDRLAQHPHHQKEKEFILSYRKPLLTQTLQKAFPPVLLQPDGRQSVRIDACHKKTAFGYVNVTMPGSGKITINGKGLEYFDLMRAREAVLYPLQLTNWLGTVDIVADIKGSGVMAQAACVRWGISVGIAALGGDFESLRLAGLLTKDRRSKERRSRGCEGARAAWTWKKR